MFTLSVTTAHVIGTIPIFLVGLFVYCNCKFQYWKRKSVPFLRPQFPLGNLCSPWKIEKKFLNLLQSIYAKIRRKNWKHVGVYFFTVPVYIVADVDYIKNIFKKDFEYFSDRGLYYNEKLDPISAQLLSMRGAQWQNMRRKITPTFTSGKIKTMFSTIIKCVPKLMKKIEEHVLKKPIDIGDIMSCFVIEVIASCAFGMDCKTFEDENSPFKLNTYKVYDHARYKTLTQTITLVAPKFAKMLGVRAIPKDISDFFIKSIKDNVAYRENNNYVRKDFLQLLIDMKDDEPALTDEQIAAQCFMFFLAGLETTSSALTFAFYELAKNQDVQQKAREEINSVLSKYDGKITYDSIQDLEYVNQVLDETLRKYPPIAFSGRKCVKDYKLQDEDITIEKGTRVLIPVLEIHYDKEYFPDPDTFDPDRFNKVNKMSLHPCAYLPYGEGPRMCIGLRFAQIQMKLVLAVILKKYKLSINTQTHEPLAFQFYWFTRHAENIWLDFEEL